MPPWCLPGTPCSRFRRWWDPERRRFRRGTSFKKHYWCPLNMNGLLFPMLLQIGALTVFSLPVELTNKAPGPSLMVGHRFHGTFHLCRLPTWPSVRPPKPHPRSLCPALGAPNWTNKSDKYCVRRVDCKSGVVWLPMSTRHVLRHLWPSRPAHRSPNSSVFSSFPFTFCCIILIYIFTLRCPKALMSSKRFSCTANKQRYFLNSVGFHRPDHISIPRWFDQFGTVAAARCPKFLHLWFASIYAADSSFRVERKTSQRSAIHGHFSCNHPAHFSYGKVWYRGHLQFLS